MKMLLSSALVLAVATAANAGLDFDDIETQCVDWSFPLSPGETMVSFKQFDDQEGMRVLKAVELVIDGKIQAIITAENNSEIPANEFGVGLTGLVDVNIGPASASLGIVQVAGPVAVTATDNGGVPNGMGTDFHDFGLVCGTDSDSFFTVMNLAVWIGSGDVMGTISGSGGFAVQGTADGTLNIDDFGASGTAKLHYYYNVIPTPGSIALAGLGGMVIIRRRRN